MSGGQPPGNRAQPGTRLGRHLCRWGRDEGGDRLNSYIINYLIPVFLLMAFAFYFISKSKEGIDLEKGVFLVIGFILGWVSAFALMNLR